MQINPSCITKSLNIHLLSNIKPLLQMNCKILTIHRQMYQHPDLQFKTKTSHPFLENLYPRLKQTHTQDKDRSQIKSQEAKHIHKSWTQYITYHKLDTSAHHTAEETQTPNRSYKFKKHHTTRQIQPLGRKHINHVRTEIQSILNLSFHT